MNRLFIIRAPEQFHAACTFLRLNWKGATNRGKPLAVKIGDATDKRSVEQNKRLHAMLSEIAGQAWVPDHETGELRQFSSEAWKEYFRREHIGTEDIDLPDGTRTTQGISTTTLDVAEFGTLMDKIEAYAVTELGVRFDEAFAA